MPQIPVNMASVDLNSDWVKSMERRSRVKPRKLKESSTGVLCSIYRVPHSIGRHDKNAYTPQIVSIGPCHRRMKRLQLMGEHKWRYLDAVLDRHGRDFLETMLMVGKTLEKRARECYSEEIELSSDSFVQMMVLDGVFLIELFYRWYHIENFKDDPIIMFQWLRSNVWDDLVMLENQIPFFILQHLFDLMNLSGTSLMELALSFIKEYLRNLDIKNVDKIPSIEVHHLLHLLHSYILPTHNDEKLQEHKNKMIPSASELHKAGIKFQKWDGDSFMFINFHNGVLQIPSLRVEDRTKKLLLNLIAFEQCYPYCPPYVTAYTAFMDWLIDSAEDVGILTESEIIDNWVGSNEEVANFFNKIGRDVILCSDHYLVNVLEDINQYYERRWPRWRAALMRNHLNNPWTIISLIAAFTLLILTYIQTFFTSFPKFADD